MYCCYYLFITTYIVVIIYLLLHILLLLFIYRTIEILYEELTGEGVVMKCPKYYLSDYIGDFRYIQQH